MISIGAGIIIANPNSGPGDEFDSEYEIYINKARDATIDVSIVLTSWFLRNNGNETAIYRQSPIFSLLTKQLF